MSKAKILTTLLSIVLPLFVSAQNFLSLEVRDKVAKVAGASANTAQVVFIAETNDLVLSSSHPSSDRFDPPVRNEKGQYEYYGWLDLSEGMGCKHFKIQKKGTGIVVKTQQKVCFNTGDLRYIEVREPTEKYYLIRNNDALHLVANEGCVEITSPKPDLKLKLPDRLCQTEMKMDTVSQTYITKIKVNTLLLNDMRNKMDEMGEEEFLERTTIFVSFENSNVEMISISDMMQREKYVYSIRMDGESASAGIGKNDFQFVVFKVTPKNARVFLDGSRLEVTDGVAQKYETTGTHHYTIECADYHSAEGSVVLGEKKEIVEVVLSPAYGCVTVSGTNAEGGVVYIDSKEVGTLPLAPLNLVSGKHKLEIDKNMYELYVSDFFVEDGKTTDLNVELAVNFAHVIFTEETGSEIYINGKYEGDKLVEKDLAYGLYEVETRKKGCDSEIATYRISAESDNKEVILKAPSLVEGSLKIMTNPIEVSVFVDGEEMDNTPCIVSLPPGRHKVVLQKQGFTTITRTVTIAANDMEDLKIELPLAEKNSSSQNHSSDVDSEKVMEQVANNNDWQAKIVSNQKFVPCESAITDYEGHTYDVVQIDKQCWMKQNLRTVFASDGTHISQGSKIASSIPLWYYPNNASGNESLDGLLYNWEAAKQVCPSGWHLPTKSEFQMLMDYCFRNYTEGSSLGNIAKSLAATTNWNVSTVQNAIGNDLSDNDRSGFSAFPAGGFNGAFYNFGVDAFFWSSTPYGDRNVYGLYLEFCDAAAYLGYNSHGCGRSVRCIRD